MGLLDEQVAVITGGAGGIGSSVARLFAKEGASILVNDSGADRHGDGASPEAAESVVAELKGAGTTALASSDDASTEAGARAIADKAVAGLGRIDVWVHAAGAVRDRGLLALEASDFDRVIQTVVHGTFFGTRAAAVVMKRNGRGRIVNTTGIAGFLGNHGQANYAAAAGAVTAMTRTASIELQRHGILVNAVAPIAKTRMTEDLPMFEHVDSMTAEHVAPVYLFLASRLSGDTTGSVLCVAGNKLTTYDFVESQGRFKEGPEPWTAEEIGEHVDSVFRK
jgi:NAD(P)-dependent dehydrogenase (short-subunit alcohol dehydrogenase family)